MSNNKERHNFYTAIMGIGDEPEVEHDPDRRFNFYTAMGLAPERRKGGRQMAEQDHNVNRDERGFMSSIMDWVDKQREANQWKGVPSVEESMEKEGIQMDELDFGGYMEGMANMVKESQGIGPNTTFAEQIMKVAPAAARFGGDTNESQVNSQPLPIPEYPGQPPAGLPGVDEDDRIPFGFMR